MKITDFSGGLNTVQPADNIRDNEFSSLLNVCYEEGGVLRSRFGMSLHRTVSNVRKIYPFYVSGTLHMIYTTTAGLYDNGTLLDATFTGTFVASEWQSMVYLTNGTYFKRYDGTTLYNVGMAAPDAPTVTTASQDKIVCDAMDTNPTDYSVHPDGILDGGAAGAVAFENGAGNYREGVGSVKMTCSLGYNGLVILRDFGGTQDWSVYSGGGVSGETDMFTIWVKINSTQYLKYMQISVYLQDSANPTDFYSTVLIVPGAEHESSTLRRITQASEGSDAVITPDSISRVYLPDDSGKFVPLQVPKGDFVRYGTDSTLDWSTVERIAIAIWSNELDTADTLDVYLDDMCILGAEGSEDSLYGRYYFCAGYYNSSRDEYYEVSTESDSVYVVSSNLAYSSVPATFPDAQADKYIIWARYETDDTWNQLVSVSEGTESGEVNHSTLSLKSQAELTEQAGIYPLPKKLQSGVLKTRATSNNSVPPVGDFIIIHRGCLLILNDDKIYHSKFGQPWAVPSKYYLTSGSSSDIFTAAYSDGSSLVVHSKTKDMVYSNPGEYDGGGLYMGYLSTGRETLGCVGPHTVGDGYFASSQGLGVFDGQMSTTISGNIKPTYRSISDKTVLHGCMYEGTYVLVDPAGYTTLFDLYSGGARVYQWSFTSTARCCCVDKRTGLLYIGTDTGIYYYNTSAYTDYEGNITVTAVGKKYEYAPEDKDLPLERFACECNAGGNSISLSMLIDGTSHGSLTTTNTSQTEEEGFFDLGAVGSKLQISFSATVNQSNPIRVYAIEAS